MADEDRGDTGYTVDRVAANLNEALAFYYAWSESLGASWENWMRSQLRPYTESNDDKNGG